MNVIIAEKPSVARELARIVGATTRQEGYIEGNGYAVTWAFGHLITLAMPEAYGIKGFRKEILPIIPSSFTLVPRPIKTDKGYKPDPSAVAQLKVIKRLFANCEKIIVATDAGREGELIFRYIYQYVGCTKPFDRLWISSLTDGAIRKGLDNLQAGSHYDNLYLAARARSEADWLVGINATQAVTIAAGRGTYSLGRVQTPTLAMVCKRYWEHRNFTPEKFWQLSIGVKYEGEIIKCSSVDKWHEKEEANTVFEALKQHDTATVRSIERKEVVQEPPLLYDLTTLQKEANGGHGFSADKTLAIARAISTLPVPLSKTLLDANNLPSSSFTFSPLYARAPYRELPTLIFATISSQIFELMPQCPGLQLQVLPLFFRVYRVMPLPFSRKNGSSTPSPFDCN